MQFQPKTEKEIAEQGLWPKGEYDFEVVKAERAVSGPQSKSPGTEFIKLNMRIFNQGGAFKFVNAILHPAMDAQLRHFCVVGKLLEQYETGSLVAEDCADVSGRLKLRVKDAEGNFPAKNEVSDYIVPKVEEAAPASTSTPPPPDDDVPF
jgi:hypothetical protein